MLRLARSICLTVLTLAAVVIGTTTHSDAGTGTVRIRTFKAGFIVGGGGGQGVLIYHGHHYPFDVGGIGIGMIGVAEARYVGTAYNLRTANDIAGGYASAGAGLAIVGGAKVARLQNSNGVVLELHGVQAGLQASLGVGGMTITPRW